MFFLRTDVREDEEHILAEFPGREFTYIKALARRDTKDGKNLMWKRELRRFVVWSSRPPLAALYQWMYRLMIRLAAVVLRRRRGIVSIYVCRGCAKDDITPGISDIDLMVVTTNDNAEKRAIQKACQVLGTITCRLIDYYPNLVTTRETLEHRWHTAPAWQYRYHEGRSTWKVLHGTDILSCLPPLTETQRRTSCYAEMNRWWLLFAHSLFGSDTYLQDAIMRNVTCYKAVTELLNAHWVLRTGEYRYFRAAGLEGNDTPLAAKLADIEARRFLDSEGQLVEDTYHFLLQFFTDLWDSFRADPYLHIYDHIRQDVDCPNSERLPGERETQHLEMLRQYLKTHWGAKYRGTHLVKSAFWNIEDFLLLIDVNGNLLPAAREVADLAALHRRIQRELPPRIFLFLLSGSVALPITPVMPRDLHRGILTPATMPDVFLQLGEKEVYWTDYTKWYLAAWQSNEQWLGASASKRLQLSAIARSAEDGHIIYPLTPAALERKIRKTPEMGEVPR